MRALRLFMVSPAVLLAACSAPPDGTLDVTFDPCAGVVIAVDSDDPAELAAVDTAVALWNGAGPLSLTRDDVAGTPRLAVNFEEAAAAFRGVYDDERGVVFINRGLRDPRTRAITVAHELGHAFGLLHAGSGAGPTVMGADNVDVEPSEADVARLRTLWDSCAGDRR